MVRRALLAGGVAAAGTVAGLWWLRKPAVVMPQPGTAAPDMGRDLGTIRPVSPPKTPPAVTFLDADGKPAGLDAWRGRQLVLNFWATWCVPCVREMPSLQALAQASPELAVVPVSSDAGGAAAVRPFYAAHAITTLPVWLDPHGTAGDAMGIAGLPTTFLIGADGTVRGFVEGGADWMALRAKVLGLLG
jgi:thiol-disulfide isomerase/thioredoxin